MRLRRTTRPESASTSIRVGFVDLDRLPARTATLSPDERARASAYASRVERRRFVAGRAFLRAVLAREVSIAPATIRFEYNSTEQPVLANDPTLAFNVAHAGAHMALAVTRGRRLGVDIERIDASRDIDAVIDETFARADRAALNSLAGDDRLRAFYAVWVRYEAAVKARGAGLVVPFDRLDRISQGLDVIEIPAPRGHVAAVATDRTPWELVATRWPTAKRSTHLARSARTA